MYGLSIAIKAIGGCHCNAICPKQCLFPGGAAAVYGSFPPNSPMPTPSF